MYFLLTLVLLIQLGAAWFANLVIWLKIVLYAILIVGGMAVLLIPTALPSMQDIFSEENKRNPIFYGEKRWLLLFFYLGFQTVTDPITALLLSLAGMLLYNLSFVSLNRLQFSIPFAPFSASATLSGLAWFYLVSLYLKNSSWYSFTLHILLPSISMPIYLLLFLFAIITFTLVMRPHWVAWISVILGAILIIFLNPDKALSISSLIGLIGLAAGVLLGISKIFFWPILSVLFQRELNHVQASQQISEELRTRLLDFTGIVCWPPPLNRASLFSEFVLRGFTEEDFPDDYSKNIFRRARDRMPKVIFGDNFTIENLINKNLTGIIPDLANNIKLLKKVRVSSIPFFEKYKAYGAVIHDLDASLVADRSRYRDRLGTHNTQAMQRLRKLAFDELLVMHNEQSAFFAKLSKLSASCKKIEPLQVPEFSEGTGQKIEATKNETLEAISQFVEEMRILEPDLEKLPSEEKRVYQEIIEAGLLISNLRRNRFDYPAQQEIILSNLDGIERTRPVVEEKWVTVKSDLKDIVAEPNPWHIFVDHLSQLLKELNNVIDLQIECAEKIVVSYLTETDKLEKIPSLTKTLDELTSLGEKYGYVLDETISRLDVISKEATAALAFPKGYNRRLGIQDTLDRLNELRSLLSTRFVVESKEIVGPLDILAKSLFASLYELSEDKVTGFRNPYLTGNPIKISRSALFKGRLELINKMVVIMRSSSNPTFILHGPRRMGKTSFLLQLPRLLPANYLPVYIDMQEGGAQSDAQFLYSLANAIYRQTKKSLNIAKPDFPTFEMRPFIAINEWLDIIYPQVGNRSLFFTIDEFEVIGKAISQGSITTQVLEYLRHLMQHNENMTLLFAGVQTIDALGPNSASYFISASPIEISYLSTEDAEELIRNPDPVAGKMPAYDDFVVQEIIRLTRGQPYLIQAICSEIIGLANERELSHIQKDMLKDAIERVLSTSLYFRNIWDDAKIEGQDLLKKIISDSGIRLTHENTFLINELSYKHVIYKQENGKYAIEIPLVELWISRQQA